MRRLVLLLGALALGAGCQRVTSNLSGGGPEAGLLRGKMPVDSLNVSHAVRLTDGIAAEPDDSAPTDLTAVLDGRSAYVTWDLGADVPVRCALIDADGANSYALMLSRDGGRFDDLWTAPVDERGQQLRAGRDLEGRGRYLRLRLGDGPWPVGIKQRGFVSEVRAWSECPTQWPALAMQKGTPDEEAVSLKLWAFAALAVGYVLAYRKRAPDWVKLLGVAPLGL
ncbi:MAG TPA: hypothetical protein VHK47_17575, partial [Polyangia bacterium]|nr:hypothetical protein [Polyangia bacterium]